MDLLISGPEIMCSVGAYDNGLLTVLVLVVTYGIVFVGPLVVFASVIIALAIFVLALLSNLLLLIRGNDARYAKLSATITLYILSALIFTGLLLALTNVGHAFVKGADSIREPVWGLAFPVVFALIAFLYKFSR